MTDEETTINTGGDMAHNLLPPHAVHILREAAATPLEPGALDPGLNRRKAVDRAHVQIRDRWPQFFRD